jgi:uncharacterized repeat protein (TIGR01451 family)
MMRVRLLVLFAALLTLGNAVQAVAAMRVTDINGAEVTVARGTAKARRNTVVTQGRRIVANAVTVSGSADIDAANNDYRRIQNAINAAAPGDTIILAGLFDFTAPFAAAAWALGNDNTAHTADDYSVSIPPNLANVTLTAAFLGTAIIQGPGDLPGLDLEGFLYFDGAGDNPGWTISNLRILDFDLSIGMFNGSGGVDSYNNTTIQNNFIRIPADLNGTVAPNDTLQNIGIHYSFGTNQRITGNTIQIAGNSAGDVVNNAAEVGMQSNTSGGAVYNGLEIDLNSIHVLNAQAATPETILGIWENGHAHLSRIYIHNNHFINDAAGNDAALNLQRGFRITSHSSATTSVHYTNNTVDEANIGFQWITGSNFAGNRPVFLHADRVTGCATGVLVQSNGVAHLGLMTITGSGAGGGVHVVTGSLEGDGVPALYGIQNCFVSGGSGDGIWIEATAGPFATIENNDLGNNAGFGLRNESAPLVVAERNWWGNNLAAAVAAEVSGNVDFDPWRVSGTDVSPSDDGFHPFVYATTSGTVTTFTGTSNPDTGALLAGDPVTMQMNDETAFTALPQLLNFDIQLGLGDDLFTLGRTGVPATFDAGAGNDMLIGTNVAQTWNITGPGSGNIPGAANSFTGVESVRGGTASDSFVFGASGSLARTLDGNLGIDSLNNSAIPAATITATGFGWLDGVMGRATGIGAFNGFDNINALVNSPADLSVTKTGPATASTTLAYTITVTNAGPNPAVNVTLTDVLPAGTTFVSLVATADWGCTTPAVNAAGTVTCTRISMPLGADPFTLTINGPATPGIVTNTATVTSANEGAPGNESGTATTNVTGVADLSITKTAPASVAPNGQISYTITVTNGGPGPATNTTVTDILPAGVTFATATPSQGSCSGTTTVTCTLGTLANGGTATIALVVDVTANTGPIVNTATVDSDETDPTPANASATATVTIAAAAADVPTASTWALLMLAMMLGALAVKKVRMS